MKRFRLPLSLSILVLSFPSSALAQYGYSHSRNPFLDAAAPGESSRIVQHLIALVLGAAVGAFLSDKLRAFRKWTILSTIALALLALAYVSTTGGNIAFFFAGAIAAYLLLRDPLARALGKMLKKPTTFGSAQWADLAHLTEHNLIGEKGFRLGFYEQQQRYPLHYTGDRHMLTIAPTRSGKGVSTIIPNLLTYTGSCLIIDPKGENARITADRRGRGSEERNIPGMGQIVHIVDPWGITGFPASHFNPLDWLNPEDEDINENAMMLADSMVPMRHGTLEPFWDEEAKALLMGILLYVALDRREQGNRTLARVRDIISLGEDDFNQIMLNMRENENTIVYSTAARTLSKEEKLRSNVLASLQAHTHFLDSSRIRASLARSDFKFEDLKTKKMTVYLVLPADRLETFGRWLRLLVQQAITVNARNIEIKPDKPILFVLDEMGSRGFGRLTMVEQAYGLMAGFGMQLWGIIQDLSQLEENYGKAWETFIGNCGVLQYFGSRDHKTADYFSKLCGVTTVAKFSLTKALASAIGYSSSNTSGGQQGGSATSGSSSSTTQTTSTTYDIVQRHLAFPDELMVLRDNKQLVLIEHFNPIMGQKTIWHEDDTLETLGVNLLSDQVKKASLKTTPAPSSTQDLTKESPNPEPQPEHVPPFPWPAEPVQEKPKTKA